MKTDKPPQDVAGLIRRLRGHAEQYNHREPDSLNGVLEDAADALAATTTAKRRPVAWIAADRFGRVHHYAEADGWTVTPVLTVDVPVAEPPPDVAGDVATLLREAETYHLDPLKTTYTSTRRLVERMAATLAVMAKELEAVKVVVFGKERL